MNILEKAIKKIKDKNLIEKNDRVVIGVSGGPDSIFLLEVLLHIKDEFNLSIFPVHINHLYRGKEAERDENFVREIGKKHNLEVFVKRKSMEELAKEEKITLEEAGREIRYSFFDEVMEKTKSNKIALAHNLDDQIETFLFRLIRGTSLEGLEGINDTRDNKYVRPINEIYKKDIMNYLDENNIPYMTDSTNLENDYTRNSIRLDLIPFIEERYNPRFKEKIKNMLEEVREVNELLEPDYSKYISDNILKADELNKEKSDYIKGKIINYYLTKNNIETTRRKIENIIKILFSGGSKKIKLEKDCTLIKEYDKIFLVNSKMTKKVVKEVKMIIPSECEFGEYIISAFREKKKRDNNYEFVTCLKEGDELFIRARKEGDKILPIGMENYKKIKDIMINSKIPKEERDKIPVILLDDEIVWVAGVRKSKKFISEDESENVVLRIRRK
ncbi:tRNA lysidine(34) synthetase TilS [Fusobacterium sp.]|uniref:tRNA lysidine(34) synthetase TilS n=1 Tax=Fusobacterium sp. TaxID=68766 RepID=UPI002606FA48|nr:tRNA lysidine(34) synthetase TilS [Fusobacterium sp.]